MTLTMAVVVDYQNVHLTGASLFLPGRPPEEGLIDSTHSASPASSRRRATPRSARTFTTRQSNMSRSFEAYRSRKTTLTPTGATSLRRPSGSADTMMWTGYPCAP